MSIRSGILDVMLAGYWLESSYCCMYVLIWAVGLEYFGVHLADVSLFLISFVSDLV